MESFQSHSNGFGVNCLGNDIIFSLELWLKNNVAELRTFLMLYITTISVTYNIIVKICKANFCILLTNKTEHRSNEPSLQFDLKVFTLFNP